MFRGYLFQRFILTAAVLCGILAVGPALVRSWIVERGRAIFAAPVKVGKFDFYPRSSTIYFSDLQVGDPAADATLFSADRTWLTFKSEPLTEGMFQIRKAVLDGVRIENDPKSQDYYKIIERLRPAGGHTLLPSIYLSSTEHIIENTELNSAVTNSFDKWANLWEREKKKLQDVTQRLKEAIIDLENTQKLSPNSLRDRSRLEASMRNALETSQQLTDSRQRIRELVEELDTADKEFAEQQSTTLELASSQLNLSDKTHEEMAKRLLRQHALAQTTVWLDYVAAGRQLLKVAKMPTPTQATGTDFHFDPSSSLSHSTIDELTLRGELSLHHRIHRLFLRGYNLHSEPLNSSTPNPFASGMMPRKPSEQAILRGEIASENQALLFDFRFLWNDWTGESPSEKLVAKGRSASEIITLESQSVGGCNGEMPVCPGLVLAWQGSKPWIWTQWRFDSDQRWKSKWIIRQEGLKFQAIDQGLTADEAELMKRLTQNVSGMDRFEMELNVTNVDDQCSLQVKSNLDDWLPKFVKTVFEAEGKARLEKIRTAVREDTEEELSQLRKRVKSEQALILQSVENYGIQLERLSADIASKLGISPRALMTKESRETMVR
jgi:hypothetical protein